MDTIADEATCLNGDTLTMSTPNGTRVIGTIRGDITLWTPDSVELQCVSSPPMRRETDPDGATMLGALVIIAGIAARLVAYLLR